MGPIVTIVCDISARQIRGPKPFVKHVIAPFVVHLVEDGRS